MTSHAPYRRRWRPNPDDVFYGTCIVAFLALYSGLIAVLAQLVGGR